MSAVYPCHNKSRFKSISPKFRVIFQERPVLIVCPSSSSSLIELCLANPSERERKQSPERLQQPSRPFIVDHEDHSTFSTRPDRGRLAFKLTALRTLSTKELISDTTTPRVHNKYRSSIKVLRSSLHPRPSRHHEPSLTSSFHRPRPPPEPSSRYSIKPRRKLKIDLSTLGLVSVGTETEGI